MMDRERLKRDPTARLEALRQAMRACDAREVVEMISPEVMGQVKAQGWAEAVQSVLKHRQTASEAIAGAWGPDLATAWVDAGVGVMFEGVGSVTAPRTLGQVLQRSPGDRLMLIEPVPLAVSWTPAQARRWSWDCFRRGGSIPAVPSFLKGHFVNALDVARRLAEGDPELLQEDRQRAAITMTRTFWLQECPGFEWEALTRQERSAHWRALSSDKHRTWTRAGEALRHLLGRMTGNAHMSAAMWARERAAERAGEQVVLLGKSRIRAKEEERAWQYQHAIRIMMERPILGPRSLLEGERPTLDDMRLKQALKRLSDRWHWRGFEVPP